MGRVVPGEPNCQKFLLGADFVGGLAPAAVVEGSAMFPRERLLARLKSYEISHDEDDETDVLRGRLAQFYAGGTLTGIPITTEDQAEAVCVLASGRLGRTTGEILKGGGGLPKAFLR